MHTFLPLLRALAVIASFGAGVAAFAAPNTLLRVGGIQDGTSNTIQLGEIQIGLNGGGDYIAPNGALTQLAGDGSVRFLSVVSASPAAFCFRNVTTTGEIKDGTSNTVLLSETVGLRVTPGSVGTDSPVRSIQDGTSNTIVLGLSGPSSFCFGDVTNVQPVKIDPLAPFIGNGVFLGAGSSFGVCVPAGRLSAPVDGSSNTIQLGETWTNVCFNDITVPAGLVATAIDVAEPVTWTVLAFAALGGAIVRRRRSGNGAARGLI